jgi:hypothetical protein
LTEANRATHESVDNDYLRSSALSGMASILVAKGEAERAIDLYRMSVALMHRVLTFGPNDAVSLSLSQVNVRLANALSKANRAAEASKTMNEAIAQIAVRLNRNPDDGGLLRIMALDLGAASLLKHRAGDKAGGCALDREDKTLWDKAQRLSGSLPMDMLADGPLSALERRLKSCRGS